MGADKTPNDDEIQPEVRKENAYQEVKPTESGPELEPYPSISKDDGVEVTPPKPGNPNGPDSTEADER